MQLPSLFPPPGAPDLPPPGPLCQMLGLLVALGLLAQLVLLVLPETWSQRVRAWLRDVEPFRQVDAWLRAQIK